MQVPYLTPFRGFGALLVMFFHYRYILPLNGKAPWVTLLHHSYVMVDLFFLLSGYILAHCYKNNFSQSISWTQWKNYELKRIFRIVPLHYSMLVFIILVEATSPVPFTSDKFQLWKLPIFFVFFQAFFDYGYSWNDPSWSIGVEFWVYPLVPLLIRLRGLLFMRILFTFVSMAGLIWITLTYGDISSAWDYGFPRGLFEVIIGISLYETPKIKYSPLLLISLLAITFGIICLSNPGLMDLAVICCYIVILKIAPCTRVSGLGKLLQNPLTEWLGTRSYSIYLVHVPVRILTERLSDSYLGYYNFYHNLTTEKAYIVFVSLVTVSLLLSEFTYRFIEQKWRRKT
jgi:peptidoglycan/LPS O-acetylase OafA/YrhL